MGKHPHDWPTENVADIAQTLRFLEWDNGKVPLLGVGHSMGGGSLLVHELANPNVFSHVSICVKP
jgi:S-formylglutathione hydrolase FrmB